MDGSFVYTPADNFDGTDSFEYALQDGQGGEAVGIATIEVMPVNDAPTLAMGTADAMEDGQPVNVDLAVLGNDVDSDDNGASLSYSVITPPLEGSALVNGTTLTFNPGTDFQDLALHEMRDAVIEVQASDSHGAVSTTANVTVTVSGENDAPTLLDGSATAMEDGPTVGVDLAALGNDVDVDDDGTTLSYAIVGLPLLEGSASISGTTLTFDSGTDFQDLAAGETRDFIIEVQATDSHGAVSETADVAVTVTGVNDAAVISGELTGTVTEDTLLIATGNLTISDVDRRRAPRRAV